MKYKYDIMKYRYNMTKSLKVDAEMARNRPSGFTPRPTAFLVIKLLSARSKILRELRTR